MSARPSDHVELADDFRGDNARLVNCIAALLEMDANGSLVPHGVGGHARTLLASAGARLAALAPVTPAGGAVDARRHPHCELIVTRDIAPDDGWHWTVRMPNGHLYDVSKGRMKFEQAIDDARKRGVVALDAADIIWRHDTPSRDQGEG